MVIGNRSLPWLKRCRKPTHIEAVLDSRSRYVSVGGPQAVLLNPAVSQFGHDKPPCDVRHAQP